MCRRTEKRLLLLVLTGHFDSGVWGVAVHPKNPAMVVTVGDDKTLRMWDVAAKRLVKMVRSFVSHRPTAHQSHSPRTTHTHTQVMLDTPARCVCFSPDGGVLAVGLGLEVDDGGLRKDGAFVILDAVTLTIIHEARDSKRYVALLYPTGHRHHSLLLLTEALGPLHPRTRSDTHPHIHTRPGPLASCRCISDIKFSPDGTVLALGSQDSTVYFYNASDFGCKAKCRGHKVRAPSSTSVPSQGLRTC
jgi:WD40 repeat protein